MERTGFRICKYVTPLFTYLSYYYIPRNRERHSLILEKCFGCAHFSTNCLINSFCLLLLFTFLPVIWYDTVCLIVRVMLHVPSSFHVIPLPLWTFPTFHHFQYSLFSSVIQSAVVDHITLTNMYLYLVVDFCLFV